MGKPLSWKGEVMTAHLSQISRGLGAIESKVINVLRAGYTDKDDFIQAFGDLLEYTLLAKNGKESAIEIVRSNFHTRHAPDDKEQIKMAIDHLQQVLDQMEQWDD